MAVFNSEACHFKYLSAENFTLTSGTLGNAAIQTNAAIDDTKLKHRYDFVLSQTGTAVAATQYLRIMQAAGSALSIEAAVTETIATGGDRTVTIDLQKSTGAGAFASILTAPIVLDNANVLRTLEAGTISSAALVDGDILKLTVAVAGAAGVQAAGVVVNVVISEAAQ